MYIKGANQEIPFLQSNTMQARLVGSFFLGGGVPLIVVTNASVFES